MQAMVAGWWPAFFLHVRLPRNEETADERRDLILRLDIADEGPALLSIRPIVLLLQASGKGGRHERRHWIQ